MDRSSLSRRQRQICDRAAEHAVAIGYTGVIGAFAAAEVEALEDFVDARYQAATSRMARRLELTHRLTPNDEFRALQTVFAVEAAKRMGVAMVGIADATEQGVQKIVERPLIEEEVSLLRLLFARRR